MQFTRTTIRAFAASVTIVAATATIAGAAVFQLPILGFGHTASASAASPARTVDAHSTRHVAPRRVVKTRYVDVIVHRRSSVAYTAGRRPATEEMSFGSAPRNAPAVVAPAVPAAPPTTAAVTPSAGGEHRDSNVEDGAASETETHPVTTSSVPARTSAVRGDQ